MKRALLLAGALFALSCTTGSAVADDRPRVVSVIRDARISESSGLALSTRQPGLVYTVNDSGNAPVVYVVALGTGRVVGTARLSGVDAVDPEALAIGTDERLYVADIGDNDAGRGTVALYALDQPSRRDVTVTPTVYEFRYADEPHDAEALVADSATGRLSVVTKGLFSGAVYQLPSRLRSDSVMTAQRVPGVRMPALVTDAAALPDGDVVVRTYTDAVVFRLPGWQRAAATDLPQQRQGESVAVTGAGSTLLLGTEGLPSPLVEVGVPEPRQRPSLPATPEPDPAGSAPAPEPSAGDSGGWWPAWAVGASTVVLGGAWLAVRRAQRHRSTT